MDMKFIMPNCSIFLQYILRVGQYYGAGFAVFSEKVSH